MNSDVDHGGPFQIARRSRPAAFCNLLSVGAPVLGVIAVVVMLGVSGSSGHWYWTWRATAAISILAGATFVGLVLAGIALVRSERYWGLSAFALLLNAPLPFVLLWEGWRNLDTWLRY